MKKIYSLPVLILLLISISCGTVTKKNIDVGLLITEDVLASTAIVIERLCEAGIVSDDDCLEMQRMYSQARTLLNESKALWDHMILIDSFVETKDYHNLITEIIQLTVEIAIIVQKYKGK